MPKPEQLLQKQINDAIGIALGFGTVQGSGHKMWVIDQMVRKLAGENYESIIAEFSMGGDGPDTHRWDEGIMP